MDEIMYQSMSKITYVTYVCNFGCYPFVYLIHNNAGHANICFSKSSRLLLDDVVSDD